MKDDLLKKAISQIQVKPAKKEVNCRCSTHVSQDFLDNLIYACIDGGNSLTISDNAANCTYKNERCSGLCNVTVKCGDQSPQVFAGVCYNKPKLEDDNAR